MSSVSRVVRGSATKYHAAFFDKFLIEIIRRGSSAFVVKERANEIDAEIGRGVGSRPRKKKGERGLANCRGEKWKERI